MTEAERIKLLGTYRTPRFKYGDTVTCAIRGPAKIAGLASGRIQWPMSIGQAIVCPRHLRQPRRCRAAEVREGRS